MNVTRADRHRLEAIVLDRSAPQKHVWRSIPNPSSGPPTQNAYSPLSNGGKQTLKSVH